jgi:hypothetical protein
MAGGLTEYIEYVTQFVGLFSILLPPISNRWHLIQTEENHEKIASNHRNDGLSADDFNISIRLKALPIGMAGRMEKRIRNIAECQIFIQ